MTSRKGYLQHPIGLHQFKRPEEFRMLSKTESELSCRHLSRDERGIYIVTYNMTFRSRVRRSVYGGFRKDNEIL
jgi:hypothetical protein